MKVENGMVKGVILSVAKDLFIRGVEILHFISFRRVVEGLPEK